jgi:hypothetical protein
LRAGLQIDTIIAGMIAAARRSTVPRWLWLKRLMGNPGHL